MMVISFNQIEVEVRGYFAASRRGARWWIARGELGTYDYHESGNSKYKTKEKYLGDKILGTRETQEGVCE